MKVNSVSFIMKSETICAKEINNILPINGAILKEKNSPISKRKDSNFFKCSSWEIRVDDPESFCVNENIEKILGVIYPYKKSIDLLPEDTAIELWVMISMNGSQSGFSISPPILDRLSKIKAELIFDIYN